VILDFVDVRLVECRARLAPGPGPHRVLGAHDRPAVSLSYGVRLSCRRAPSPCRSRRYGR
jgi:hypothetical protein